MTFRPSPRRAAARTCRHERLRPSVVLSARSGKRLPWPVTTAPSSTRCADLARAIGTIRFANRPSPCALPAPRRRGARHLPGRWYRATWYPPARPVLRGACRVQHALDIVGFGYFTAASAGARADRGSSRSDAANARGGRPLACNPYPRSAHRTDRLANAGRKQRWISVGPALRRFTGLRARCAAVEARLAAGATRRPDEGHARVAFAKGVRLHRDESWRGSEARVTRRVAGFSVSHFKALFRNAVGMPAHRYVMHRRVERACVCLASGMNTMDAALATGFAHPSHMTRCIRAIRGAHS